MAQKQEMRDCRECGRKTLHLRQSANHVLHLLLTLVTFGVWGVVWFLLALSPSPPVCTGCGSKHKGFRIV